MLVGFSSYDTGVSYKLNGSGIFFDQGWYGVEHLAVGSLVLLTIMLLVDIITLKCSLEEHHWAVLLTQNGLVTKEAAVF